MRQLPLELGRRTQLTSVVAYRDIGPELSDRQQVVFECLAFFGPMSNMEIAERLKKPINTITPRVFELRQKGRVKNCGTARCPVTGKTVNVWGVV